MTLAEVIPSVTARLASHASLRLLPCLLQGADDFNKKYEAALAAPGALLSVWLAGGSPPAGDSVERHDVELDNQVIVAICVNPAKNTTGRSAEAWAGLVLGALHHGGRPARKGPPQAKIDAPSYELGPVKTGLSIYFVNLRVRSVDPLA